MLRQTPRFQEEFSEGDPEHILLEYKESSRPQHSDHFVTMEARGGSHPTGGPTFAVKMSAVPPSRSRAMKMILCQSRVPEHLTLSDPNGPLVGPGRDLSILAMDLMTAFIVASWLTRGSSAERPVVPLPILSATIL